MEKRMHFYEGTEIPTSAVIFQGKRNYLGVVEGGYFASADWLKKGHSNDVIGRSFGWFDWNDQISYRNHKDEFRPVTQKEWDNAPEEYKEACLKKSFFIWKRK